jgi:hypothetical protein
MFFVRAALVIFVVVLLLPTNDREKSDFYIAVGRTLSDLGGFCTRNPDVCERVNAAFHSFIRKLRETTQMIEERVREGGEEDRPKSSDHPRDQRLQQGTEAPSQIAPASHSQHTLKAADLQPAWRGPGDI